MTETTPRVFLSYARADRARVGKLAEALQAAGIAVWWDTAIETGSRFSADIERELNAADVVVVVWSAASVNSAWVLDEAGAGRDRGRLVPVQIDATLPPLGFRQYQATDLAVWKGRASDPKFVALVGAIMKMAGSEATAAPAPTPAPATGPNRRALIGGAAGVAVLAAGGFGARKFLGRKADDGTASVVVLPFANLSGDPAQAFFSDGIAEELRNALSQIRGLKVIGRVSSEAFRDTKDVTAAAEKLGVDHVLTGSVRRSPTTIRIAAQLVEGKTGVESWSASYDQPVGDALAIQSKIATSVVAALSAKLGAAVGAIVVGGTRNVQAQELALKGRALYFENPSVENFQRILALFEEALTLDPNYAIAWAGVGFMKGNLAFYSNSATEREVLRREQGIACRKAVALAPNSGVARVALAVFYQNDLDMRAAVEQAETAERLEPGSALVLANASVTLMCVDPDRAVAVAQQSTALDPLNATYFDRLARALLSARRYREAVEAARQTVAFSQGRFGHIALNLAMFSLGQNSAVRANLPRLTDPIERLMHTAILEHRLGNRAASDAAVAALRSSTAGQVNVVLTVVHAQRGETSAALETLEEALRRREDTLVNIAVDNLYDPIRNEPRFKAVQDAVIPPDLWVPPKRR